MDSHQHHTNCADFLGMLSDYVDGDLRAELCQEIEQHMAGCENCRVVVDTTKKTVYLVHASDDSQACLPDDVRDRLFRRLNLEDYLQKHG